MAAKKNCKQKPSACVKIGDPKEQVVQNSKEIRNTISILDHLNKSVSDISGNIFL